MPGVTTTHPGYYGGKGHTMVGSGKGKKFPSVLQFKANVQYCTVLNYRIGVEIARGVARCVEKAATGGWVGSGSSRGHSHEYDRDC